MCKTAPNVTDTCRVEFDSTRRTDHIDRTSSTTVPRFTRRFLALLLMPWLCLSNAWAADAPNRPQAAQETAAKRVASKGKHLAKKIVKPIQITLAELSHPIELLKSTGRRVWPHTEQNYSQPMPGWSVSANNTPVYVLRGKDTLPTAGRTALYRYMDPLTDETYDTVTTWQSGTELQVRMRGNWSMLYEVSRTGTTTNKELVGVGMGLRYSF
jgi:hypothetical protein